MINSIISILGMIFSVYGNIALGKKHISGFYAFLLGNLMWGIYAIFFAHNIPMLLQYTIFTGTNIFGIIEYRKDNKNGKS